jgi:hypothetical protein
MQSTNQLFGQNIDHRIINNGIFKYLIHKLLMDSDELILILQSQNSDIDRINTLRRLVDNVSIVTPMDIIRCVMIYNADHWRSECVNILSSKANIIDSENLVQLLRCFDSDYEKVTTITYLSNNIRVITSQHIENILVSLDTDHAKNSVLKTLLPKIAHVIGKDLENILRTFGSDYGKNSAIEILGQKIMIDVTDMLSIGNQFDSDYSKTEMIEQLSGYLQPSTTKIPIITFWTSLDPISDEKKLTLVKQNIDSLDFKYSNAMTFCDSLSTISDDVKIFVSICEICGIPESIYKAVIDETAEESTEITICDKKYNINDFELGKMYTINFEDMTSSTTVRFTCQSNNHACFSTHTVNKKYNYTSTYSSDVTLKNGIVIGKESIF